MRVTSQALSFGLAACEVSLTMGQGCPLTVQADNRIGQRNRRRHPPVQMTKRREENYAPLLCEQCERSIAKVRETRRVEFEEFT